ncbi:heme oxygenase [Stackebrandtia albiflava]|uniref:Heme oxygenase n=1 Tax=Stackebrandtia albiflava TaxID=406432 RepID=A0A562V412_9ACTN|nr:biliverdin-producing heme oxygenase [Stackebrandtia albiflava]TWJ12562.1 heme oxygenase [Stackebrandtia albiflava]
MTLDAPTTPFSAALRQATWARHEGVVPSEGESEPDGPGVLAALLAGELHLDDYTALHAQQFFVYDVLDEASRAMAGDPVAGPFCVPELSRAAAFDADLSMLIGADWRDRITPLAATTRYVDRLRRVCFDWPGGFVAHHYTRFLGDLSGGQAFRAAANDSYGFGDGPGVSFYVFDGIGDLTEFKQGYRARLDAAGFGPEERRRVIAEVLDAYDYNEALLAELARGMRRSV